MYVDDIDHALANKSTIRGAPLVFIGMAAI
jgi:hypothetical protein